MSIALEVKAGELKAVANNMLRIDQASIGASAVKGLNRAVVSVYDESRRRMLSGVNLTDAYVRARMDVEPANDAAKPSALILAFRSGGRRPGTRPTNLRQYAAVQQKAPNNWSNSGIATNSGVQIADPNRPVPGRRAAISMRKPANAINPRAAGKGLPFIRRIGARALGIPVGFKQAGISVEVTKGSRDTLPFAFLQTMRNGETLVMSRVKGSPGKGKIKALYSLAVWQLFRRNIANVIPFAQKRVEDEVSVEVLASIKKAVL